MFLSDFNIQPCQGCRTCFDKGEKLCPLKDDLLKLKEYLNDSDIIVAASPVYVEDVNGTMKNWIDRMAFVSHRPEYFYKSAFIMATSGVGSTNHALITMKTALRTWGFTIFGQKKIKLGDLTETKTINKLYTDKICQITNKIQKSYRSKKISYPGFLSLLTFKIQQLYYQQQGNKKSLDYKYWQNNGWLNNHCYYYNIKVSVSLKVFLARITGTLIARIMLK